MFAVPLILRGTPRVVTMYSTRSTSPLRRRNVAMGAAIWRL